MDHLINTVPEHTWRTFAGSGGDCSSRVLMSGYNKIVQNYALKEAIV